MIQLLIVFAGGGLGSVCRWGIGVALLPLQPRFPWATLLANALACLILGALVGQQMNGGLSDQRRLLLTTGFCGGFSTFSTFTAETWQLWNSGQSTAMMLNLFGSLVVCFGCLLLGIKLTS